MQLYDEIKKVYPELDQEFYNGTIVLQNDSDEKGDYIAEWNYDKSLPDGMKLGK